MEYVVNTDSKINLYNLFCPISIQKLSILKLKPISTLQLLLMQSNYRLFLLDTNDPGSELRFSKK